MKLYYYIPFGLTYIVSKIIELLKGKAHSSSLWYKYFSTGYNRENFTHHMDDMEKDDVQSYKIIVFCTHAMTACIIASLGMLIW